MTEDQLVKQYNSFGDQTQAVGWLIKELLSQVAVEGRKRAIQSDEQLVALLEEQNTIWVAVSRRIKEGSLAINGFVKVHKQTMPQIYEKWIAIHPHRTINEAVS